jgi:hypothetical protein
MSAIEEQRDDLLCKLAKAEDEASELRAAIFRAIAESDHQRTGMLEAFHILNVAKKYQAAMPQGEDEL